MLKLKVQLKKKHTHAVLDLAHVSHFSKQKQILGDWPHTAFDVRANTNAWHTRKPLSLFSVCAISLQKLTPCISGGPFTHNAGSGMKMFKKKKKVTILS